MAEKESSPDINIEETFSDKKFTLAFSKLLEESLIISDDTILEKLFIHLVEKIKSDGFTRKTLRAYVQWLYLVIKRWNLIQSSIQTFAIRLAGVIASEPVGFFMLEEQEVVSSVTEHVQQSYHDSSMMLAVVNFITETVKHDAGLNWVIQTEIWRTAVKLCHTDISLYTSKASAKFITTLILLLEQSDKDTCHLIIDAIVEPLCIAKTEESSQTRMELLQSLQSRVNPDGGDLLPVEKHGESPNVGLQTTVCKKTPISTKVPRRILLATIRFLNEVLDALLVSKMSVTRVNSIFKFYSLEVWAWEQVYVENEDIELLRCLASMLTLLSFLGAERGEQGELCYRDIELLNIVVLRLVETLIYKRQYVLVFDICVQCQRLRYLVIKRVVYDDEQMEKSAFDLGNQLIMIQGLPLFVFVKVTAVHSNDVMDKYAEKLFAMSHNETSRACFQFRNLLRVTPNVNMGVLSQQAVVSMMRCINYVDRKQAVIIFQTMIHALRQFVPEEYLDSSSITSESQSLVEKCASLLMHLLECITIIMNKFHITWNESLETLCLFTFSQALISKPNITPRLCSQVMKLIQQTIENFIPPNLVLLVDTLENSSLKKLGALLLSKLHDNSWEVRDSALEVLQVIGRLSDVLFPAFETLLFEPHLLDVMVSLVANDLESYVRSTAMTCLCDLVKVKNLWEKKLSSMHLPHIAMELMCNDTEGLVRKGACQLVTTIYKHQKVSVSVEKEFHRVMYHAAVHDLHWEVKKCALDYWEVLLDQELSNEGMIDGAFPSFTFSKQSHKIISLTHSEIQKCLARVLDNLSRVGCLQVLWMSLNDECDLEVVRAAVRVIRRLMNLLVSYSNSEDLAGIDKSVNKSPWMLVYDTFSAENSFICVGNNVNHLHGRSAEEEEGDEEMPDKITQNAQTLTDTTINHIVEHSDIDLLSTMYKLNSKWEYTNVIKTPQEFITPKDFLAKIAELDIDKMLTSRSSWLENVSENLESLLDDVLAVNCDLPEHINNVGLDCY